MRKIIILTVAVSFSILASGQNCKTIGNWYCQQISDEYEIISDTYGMFDFDANSLSDKLNISCYAWFTMIETNYSISVRDALVGTTGIIPESLKKNGTIIMFYGTRLKMKADGEEAVPCLVWNEQIKKWEGLCCYLQFVEAFSAKPLSARTSFFSQRKQIEKADVEAKKSSPEYLKKTLEQGSEYWRNGGYTSNDNISTQLYYSKDGKYEIAENYKDGTKLSMVIVKNIKLTRIEVIYSEINSNPVSKKEGKNIYYAARHRVRSCEAWVRAESKRCEKIDQREEWAERWIPFYDVIGPNNR